MESTELFFSKKSNRVLIGEDGRDIGIRSREEKDTSSCWNRATIFVKYLTIMYSIGWQR